MRILQLSVKYCIILMVILHFHSSFWSGRFFCQNMQILMIILQYLSENCNIIMRLLQLWLPFWFFRGLFEVSWSVKYGYYNENIAIVDKELQYSHDNIAIITQRLQYYHWKYPYFTRQETSNKPPKDQMKQSGLQYSHDNIAFLTHILQYSHDHMHMSSEKTTWPKRRVNMQYYQCNNWLIIAILSW